MVSITKKAPTCLRDVPEYVEAEQKLAALCVQRDEIARQIAETDAAINSAAQDSGSARLERAAAAVVAGREPSPADLAQLRETVAVLRQRRVVQERAIEMQKREVAEAAARASREICDAVRPEYQDLLRRMAHAVVDLGRLADEEAAFRDHLAAGDVAFAGHLKPMPLGTLRLSEYASKANLWLDELERDHGITVKVQRRRTP